MPKFLRKSRCRFCSKKLGCTRNHKSRHSQYHKNSEGPCDHSGIVCIYAAVDHISYDKRYYEFKHGFEQSGVRVVPPAVARYGAYLAPTAVMMPSYVNIGAHVGAGTMVDTWATVGSCAQVGEHVHLSGGVGSGGVLEPLQAAPVNIEDNCFIGSRAIIVEGVRVCREAVIAAGTVLTASTHIIDVTGTEPVTLSGYVPPRSVVIPGTRTKHFPAGDYGVPCALIIGQRKKSTDLKTSLNEALRLF